MDRTEFVTKIKSLGLGHLVAAGTIRYIKCPNMFGIVKQLKPEILYKVYMTDNESNAKILFETPDSSEAYSRLYTVVLESLTEE